MAELKATVCLQGKDIEVISSHIEFNRKTDNKGRPVTNVIGGRITITVESTRETTILEAMVNSPFKAISGKVIYYNTKDNSIFRVVEFKYAYIVYYKEVWLSGNFWLLSFKISYLCLPLFHETRTTPSCHPSGCAYRQL